MGLSAEQAEAVHQMAMDLIEGTHPQRHPQRAKLLRSRRRVSVASVAWAMEASASACLADAHAHACHVADVLSSQQMQLVAVVPR